MKFRNIILFVCLSFIMLVASACSSLKQKEYIQIKQQTYEVLEDNICEQPHSIYENELLCEIFQ